MSDDDIVEGIVKLIDKAPIANKDWDESKDDLSTSFAPYKIYNIGNNNPVKLMRFINALESALGKEAEKVYMEMQPGDVLRTYKEANYIKVYKSDGKTLITDSNASAATGYILKLITNNQVKQQINITDFLATKKTLLS